MSIDINVEKQRTLSTQDIYDILHFAAQSAEDNGFVNSFVFTRAIYAYAAMVFYPERKEELAALISDDLLGSWDKLVEDGTIDKMMNDYTVDVEILGNTGETWLAEYTEYAQSARGLLDNLQTVTGDIASAALERFNSATKNEEVKQVLDIADKWGMNNSSEKEQGGKKPTFEIVENTKDIEDAEEDTPLFIN